MPTLLMKQMSSIGHESMLRYLHEVSGVLHTCQDMPQPHAWENLAREPVLDAQQG